MVKPFDEQPGIIKVTSGYTGGDIVNPSYEQVKTGETGHYEAVEIIFDPQLFSYEKLLSLYWPQIDPTDERGQFFDRGPQYRTAIFYHTEAQKKQAEKSRLEVVESGRFSKPIVTKILQAAPFYEAEDEHQTFYKKNPVKYKQEQEESGRKTFIETNWL
jgi:peptide-methionine (S)-S-oxide reductase